VSERRLSDDALRQAFQSVMASSAQECTADDVDRVWRALEGELPAAERRSLVARLATEPALAEAWRLAHHLRRTSLVGDASAAPRRPSRAWSMSSVAAAAVLVLAVAVGVMLRRDGSTDATFRAGEPNAIEALTDGDAVLPREAFRLRWSPGPQDSRYDVRATTESLDLLAAATDLGAPEWVIDPARLAGVPSGARILWQVEVLLPGGERVVSPTFVVRLGP
jgi:hypothetical protein